MTGRPQIGLRADQQFRVEPKHAIDFADEQMPAVLATPWLVWFLEHTARAALLPLLEATESTVGVELDLRHTAPTPVGQTVTCVARVILVEGTRVTFQLEAHDQTELIARGIHRLQVIRVDRFAARVRAKQSQHNP